MLLGLNDQRLRLHVFVKTQMAIADRLPILAFGATKNQAAVLAALVVKEEHACRVSIARKVMALDDQAREIVLVGDDHARGAIRLHYVYALHRQLFELQARGLPGESGENRNGKGSRNDCGVNNKKAVRREEAHIPSRNPSPGA